MATVEVKVPDIGDFKDVEVIEVLVKPGDTIKVEQSLVTVESDKASMEIPSSAGGVVKALVVKLGDKISEGSLLLVLEGEGSAAAPRPSPQPSPARAGEGAAQPSSPSPAPAAEGRGEGRLVEVTVPDIGDFDEVAVIEVLVKVGDAVAVEQSLITVESDKASMEIPSAQAGVIKELKVKVGDKVAKGSVIASLEATGTSAVAASAAPPAAASAPVATKSLGIGAPSAAVAASPVAEKPVPTAALPAHEPSAPQGTLPHASPTIRKLARELGVPLPEVKGSGPKGRITQDDIQSFVKAVMAGSQRTKAQAASAPAASSSTGGFPGLPAWPQVDFAKFGPIEKKDLSRIKKISGPALQRNWITIPHVTNHDDADITDLEAFRVLTNKENEKTGAKVTMLAFLVKACVAALQKFPDFNASLEGDHLVLKKYFHIGFAADTPNGLVVPVIKDADKKGVLQISAEMGELAKKARDGKLSPADMSGGCFSISSLGGIGGRYFTPIVNAPEVAILGVCRSLMQPVWDGKAFQPRLLLPLSLSWDHRVVDGASAARFNAFLIEVLGDFRRVLL
ncbi:MAG: dihydrolipoyllysine-residue acetyltransferase [Pseudomonadota bacterium]|nr:dihydrolipoyllysine-residue acetyltransferase [Pseudomonadota bacterium]